MALFKSLFGTPTPDYILIIRNIASQGGKGIIKSSYNGFAKYLEGNADILQSNRDALHAECRIDGKEYSILLNRELANGKDTGRTILSANPKIPVNWNDPNMGEVLKNAFNPFMQSQNDIENTAISIYWAGSNRIISDTQAGGELKSGGKSSVIAPPALKAFGQKFTDNKFESGQFKVIQEVAMLAENLTAEAGETELRTKVIYSIADAIVREHNL